MSDEDFIRMAAECAHGDHGAMAKFAAGIALIGNGLVGTVFRPARQFVDETLEAVEDLEEQRLMDLMTLPVGVKRK